MEISRTDLYERVWKTPLRKLAAEFGVSDVAVAKACRRHAIPTPPAGHWMRVEYGKAVERPPLPPAPQGDTVTLSEERSQAQRVAAPPGVPPVAVPLAADVTALAPHAKATLAALKKAKPTAAGLVSSGGAAHFACVVSPALVERTARILDAIERKLPEMGGEVTRGDDKSPLSATFGGQKVTFTLTERYTRTEFIRDSERKSAYPRKEFAYHLTGELRFAIDGYFDGRKTWSDGVRAKLEDKLPEMLAGLAGAAAAMRKIREEREEQSRRWEEQARIRAEQEAVARRHLAFRTAFAAEAAGWQRHHAAASYLSHLREALAAADAPLPDVSTEWLAHAEQAVGQLDPTGARLALLQQGCKPDWASAFGQRLVDEAPSKPPYM